MKGISIILTILIVLFSQITKGCDCDYEGNFLKVAPRANLIALVKVKNYLSYEKINNELTPMSMEVEIVEVYKGKEVRKNIIIWGDNGVLCRPYISQFDTAKYFIIALYKGSEKYGQKNEKESDYSISNCGDYWLGVDIINKVAFGRISDSQKEISLIDLKLKL